MKSPVFAIAAIALGAAASAASATAITDFCSNDVLTQCQSQMQQSNMPFASQVHRQWHGTYALSDGRTMTLYRNAKLLMIKLSGQRPIEVRALGNNRLQSVDDALELSFEEIDGLRNVYLRIAR
jgi:hypothetical protein